MLVAEEYQTFKEQYLEQYHPERVAMFESIEDIEHWTLDTDIQGLATVFNRLPTVCSYPISSETQSIVTELVVLMAYLPYRDFLASLAYCGLANEDWGLAIYEVSYEIYQAGAESDIEVEAYSAAKTIVERIDMAAKIAALQIMTGTTI